MRCIEISSRVLYKVPENPININMRCIEMYGQINPLQPQMEININMRCIEIQQMPAKSRSCNRLI